MAAETGGVLKSVRHFAKGGIVKGRDPQLAVIGEGISNEAVVPLPDGKRISVELRGGAGNVSMVVNVTGIDTAGMADWWTRNTPQVEAIMRKAVRTQLKFREDFGLG